MAPRVQVRARGTPGLTLRCARRARQSEWKTSLVFWGPGADSPGWLVRCLDEFGRREINLTKIESRPKRERMGSYMFFVDLQGRLQRGAAVAEAMRRIEGDLRGGSRARLLPRRRRSRALAMRRMRRRADAGKHATSYRDDSVGAIATLRRYRWIAPFHL